MLSDHVQIIDAFLAQGEVYRNTVAAIAPTDLELPGLGVWSVGELLGHSVRAYTTVDQGLGTPRPDPLPDGPKSAADYLRGALGADPAIHDLIAERGAMSFRALGDEPLSRVIETSQRVELLVCNTDLASPCLTAAGWMELGQFLVTRVMELVLHGTDLQAALGRQLEADPGAAAMTGMLLAQCLDRVDPLSVARVLSGRSGPINVLS